MEVAVNTNDPILIQSRGALFGFDQVNEELLFTSANAHEIVGAAEAEDLLGLTVRDCLGSAVAHAMRNAESQPTLETRRMFMGGFDLPGGSYDLTIFSSRRRPIIEAVQSSGERDPTAYDVLKDVEVLSDSLLTAADLSDGLIRLVALFRTMSGYHCVALDRDGEDGPEIVAVAGRSELVTVMGMGARQLHVFEDHKNPGVALCFSDGVARPEMSLSALRFPPEAQLELLRSGPASGSACVGIWRGSRRWGSLWFLHGVPRVPNKRTQLALAHLTPLIGQVLLSGN